MTLRIAIIGYGKIAQDQHLPVIAKNPAFELIATSSTRGLKAPGARDAFKHHADLLKVSDIDAVAICTPPQVRHRIARAALEAGKHVMLEKPPAATMAELTDLERIAKKKGLVLFTTWPKASKSCRRGEVRRQARPTLRAGSGAEKRISLMRPSRTSASMATSGTSVMP